MKRQKETNEEATGETSNGQESAVNKNIFAVARYDENQYERLNLPNFLRPEDFPIGTMLEAKVKRVIGNFTGNPDLDHTKNLWLVHEISGEELIMPCTGVIAQAMVNVKDPVGKVFCFVRKPDQVSKKFKNRMFMFEVFQKKEVE